MTYKNPLHRSGLTAIAAVLAFSATPLFAQDATGVQPVTTAPTTTAPVADPIAPLESTTTTTTTATTTDPLAPEATATTAAPAAQTTTRTTTRRTVRVARPASSAVAVPPRAVAAPVMAAASAAPLAVAPLAPPVVDPAPLIAPAPAPVEDGSSLVSDDTLPIAGAAGLALLALVGAGAAMRRRKRRDQDEVDTTEYTEPSFAAAPRRVEPAAAIAPRQRQLEPSSAFGWSAAPAAAASSNPLPAGIDRATIGGHVEAAYRGPTADNPSLSLKKRLKRATFFEQRERQVAKGEAVAVAPGAGLPAALGSQAARVHQAAKAAAPREVKFQRSFQPAWS